VLADETAQHDSPATIRDLKTMANESLSRQKATQTGYSGEVQVLSPDIRAEVVP